MPTIDAEEPARRPASHTRKARSAGTGTAVRALGRRVHFLAGILVAPFLVVLCLTGLLYVFSPQIHDSLYHSLLYVHDTDGQPRPLSEQIEAALTAHPEAHVAAAMPPPAPDRTTRVMLSFPGIDTTGEAITARAVFVDPYTNYINGELTTVADQLPANTWLRNLHSNLHLGDAGRLYSELAASWLPFVVLGGVVIWLLQPGRKRRLRELLVPSNRGKAERLRLRGVHGPVGLWLAVGLLLLGVTGVTMSQFAGGRTEQAVNPFAARAPTLTAAPVEVPANSVRIGIDRAVAVAKAEGLGDALVVTPPSTNSRPFTVVETSAGLPFRHGSIAIDPFTARVTEHVGWDDYPFVAKLATIGVAFHTGTLFGLANQIIVALLAVGTIVLIWLGYRMWWKRGPYQRAWAPPPPPAWRQLARPHLALSMVAAAAIGWLLPVLGGSLVGFVVLDAAINATMRRRQMLRDKRTVTSTASTGTTVLVRRLRRHPVIAATSAALVASVVLALAVLWPFGAAEVGDALPAPAGSRPGPAEQTPEPTPLGPRIPRTPTPDSTPSPSGADPVSVVTPSPETAPSGGYPGEPETPEPPGPLPTERPPTSSPNPEPSEPGPSPTPPPTPSPTPSPSPPPNPPPNPPPGEETCTIQVGDLLCLVVDLGW